MSARGAAVNAEFMLQANHVDIRKVQIVGRPPIGGQLLLLNFEADLGRIIIAAFNVVDRNDKAHSTSGYWLATALRRSNVNVAMPHLRGK